VTRYGLSVFLLLLAGSGNAAAASSSPPDVLWIMLDDGRADALSCYGRPWADTPNMDRVAREGVRFETAIVQNPVCVPSRTSMKTSLYAHQTGVMAMGKPASTPGRYRSRARTEYPNLLNAWSEAGITPENVGKAHAFREDWRLLGDAPSYLDNRGRPTPHLPSEWRRRLLSVVRTKTHQWMIGGLVDIPPGQIRTARLGDLALGRLRELVRSPDPFFLRVSFHAPHVACSTTPSYFVDPSRIDLPLPTPGEIRDKPRYERENIHVYSGAPHLSREEIGLARGTYYGMIRAVDREVGRLLSLLEQAGRLDETIIVINSDQGFQLGEHRNWKKRDFYDTNVKVPFILRAPGLLPQGKVVTEPVEMVDFLPTLMELSGFDPPAGIRGRSLLPLIRGEVREWRRACFSEHDHSEDAYEELRRGGGRRVMVRTREWKLVFFMDERVPGEDGALYQLRNDPWEQRNLYGDPAYRSVVEELKRMAREWDRGVGAPLVGALFGPNRRNLTI